MPTRYSRKGGRSYKKGGVRPFDDASIMDTLSGARGEAGATFSGWWNSARNKLSGAREETEEKMEEARAATRRAYDNTIKAAPAPTEVELPPPTLNRGSANDPVPIGGKRRGGRRTRGGKRRGGKRYRGGSGDTGGGTWKDITSSTDSGATPMQATDYNNDGSDSGSPWSGSSSKPWGNSWDSWALGPSGGGPHPSWGAPSNLSNISVSIGGGSTKGKKTRKYKHPKKGQKSRTMKGKKDFTTKKRSKLFNRRKHRQNHPQGSKKVRQPYKKGGARTRKYKHPKKGQKSRTMKGKKDFTTKKRSNWFNRRRHRQNHAQGSKIIRLPYMTGGGCGCQKGSNNNQSMNLMEE